MSFPPILPGTPEAARTTREGNNSLIVSEFQLQHEDTEMPVCAADNVENSAISEHSNKEPDTNSKFVHTRLRRRKPADAEGELDLDNDDSHEGSVDVRL